MKRLDWPNFSCWDAKLLAVQGDAKETDNWPCGWITEWSETLHARSSSPCTAVSE